MRAVGAEALVYQKRKTEVVVFTFLTFSLCANQERAHTTTVR